MSWVASSLVCVASGLSGVAFGWWCRLPVEAMQALEDKIRSLEQFLRARRNQRRGHYGRVMGVGDMSAYGERHTSPFGVDGFARGEIPSRSPMMITYETPQPRAARATLPGSTNKRQRLPHKELSPAELAAMEVGRRPRCRVSMWWPRERRACGRGVRVAR